MVQVSDHDIAMPPLIWPTGDERAKFSYDRRRDTLFMRYGPKRPAVSLDVGGQLWLRFEPETGEVLGVEIEDFEKVFLVHNPEMRRGWNERKPRVIKWPQRDPDSIAEYLRVLLLFIQRMFQQHPHQRPLPIR